MEDRTHDLVVIGAGPGGYVAAIRAAQLGMNVACVDREAALGGTCLRVGCVPSKILLDSSERWHEAVHELPKHGVTAGALTLDLPALQARKDAIVKGLTDGVALLFKQNGVTRYHGAARLDGPGRVVVEGPDAAVLVAPRVLIAAGSRAASLPGVELDGDRIADSTAALSWTEAPGRLVVIGAGYIGMELGSVWLRLGSKVTVVEYLDRILPGTDAEIAREAQKLFKRQGFSFKLGARVEGARVEGSEVVVRLAGAEPLRADRVLVAVGRAPATDDLGLETVGVRTDAKGRLPVEADFRTSAAGVFAIGDCVPGAMLAHKAEEEGMACVEAMNGRAGHVDYDAIPGVVYTQPEIAAVGRTEEELTAAGREFRKGVFHFRANSRARCLGQIDGRVKILADAATDRILGVHVIGPRAGDLIAEAVAALAFGASSEDVARICHAHPTLSEALKEAALAVDERAIHA